MVRLYILIGNTFKSAKIIFYIYFIPIPIEIVFRLKLRKFMARLGHLLRLNLSRCAASDLLKIPPISKYLALIPLHFPHPGHLANRSTLQNFRVPKRKNKILATILELEITPEEIPHKILETHLEVEEQEGHNTKIRHEKTEIKLKESKEGQTKRRGRSRPHSAEGICLVPMPVTYPSMAGVEIGR